MTTYILSNGMLAAGTIEDTLFYAGKFYETVEDMEGDFSFTDAEGNELTVVGMVDEVSNQTVAVYAKNESEYDIIREHLSLNSEDVYDYKRFYTFNNHVFFGRGSETCVYVYDDHGNTLRLETLQGAEYWAENNFKF